MSAHSGITRRHLIRVGLLILACAFLLTPETTRAAESDDPLIDLLPLVMPDAYSFSEKSGDPPVYRAYSLDEDDEEEVLYGYVFNTADVPPNLRGYAGTIDTLVGLKLDGTITGIKVLRYSEPMKRIIGDFLNWPGVQEQFTGKKITDPFRVGVDVDGVTSATITIRALARDIRKEALLVTKAYINPPSRISEPEKKPANDQQKAVLGTPTPAPEDSLNEIALVLADIEFTLADIEYSLTEMQGESTLDLLVDQAPRIEVFGLLLLFLISIYAFVRKSASMRWITLGYTVVFLGFRDGTFLSISQITNSIDVGPSLFTNDLVLLLVVVFTIATTLLWGRVFCGFVCPFGAVQTLLARIVPTRFQREIPRVIHDRAVYIKYALLVVLLGLAISPNDLMIYQYIEPFGTIFYLSTSAVLWIILVGILAASAIVPQFYCRYACPLGAALGIASLLTLFRIKRVQQCGLCNLCEQSCPTGAIRGTKIEFRECTRCNICEIKLRTRAGTCRHDIEKIRERFKNWQPVPVRNPS